VSAPRRSPLLEAARWFWSPTGLLVSAFVLRLAFILQMGNRFYFADTAEYETAALNLMHGHLPGGNSPRAPLFPLLMATGFVLGGLKNYTMCRMLQLALGMGLVVITGRIARRLGGAGAERLALFGAAWAPTLVFTTGMLYPTTLYATLLTGIVAVALQLVDEPTLARGALLGVLIPLGWVTDQVIIAPVSVVLLWLLSQRARAAAGFTRAFAMAAIVAMSLIGPYVAIQHEAYSHKAVFMEKAQFVLYWSRSDHEMDADRLVHTPVDSTWKALPTKAFLAQEWRFMRTQPADYLHDVVWEFLHFFKPMPDRVQTHNRYNQSYILLLGAIYFLPVLLFSVIGLMAGNARGRERLLLALVVLGTAGFYSLFFTQTRYRIPVEPLMIVLAAVGLQRLFPRLSTQLGNSAAEPR
jgi:hypothetical protein